GDARDGVVHALRGPRNVRLPHRVGPDVDAVRGVRRVFGVELGVVVPAQRIGVRRAGELEPRGADLSAEPDVLGERIDGDAVVVLGQVPDAVVVGVVGGVSGDGRMRVLEDAGAVDGRLLAGIFAVAGRVAGEVRLAQSEAVVAAEPDVVGAVLVDDADDVAELLAAAHLVRHDVGAGEDV